MSNVFTRYSLTFLFTCLALRSLTAAEPSKINFNRDIRPLLSDKCFQCHGPDDKKREGGLRLDLRESAIKPLDSGETALVPGDLSKSALVKRILSSDQDEMMPPKKLNKILSPEQIDLLKRWVAEGAEYQGHWAFLPVERPTVPKHENDKWSRSAIDHFILARLEKEKLQPSAEANKRTLVRRLSLDLTGLPPTPAEVVAFLADDSPDAYEKVVDRLLASSRYGEQMALQWLDFARFADSNGFQADSSRQQWPWRDWVIRAYNDNIPFDRFTIDQLAGDLVPNATKSQIVATGFNRNHRLNGEGGLIAEEWRVETVIDRVETTGLTWLGLTLNCCRCHDHKYDPITQKEFYQLFAFYNNITETGTLQAKDGRNNDPVELIATPDKEAELAKIDQAIKAAEDHLANEVKKLPKLSADWAEKHREQISGESSVWKPLAVKDVKSSDGAKLTKKSDGSYLASGKNAPHDTYTITAPLDAGSFTGILLECFPDPMLPQKSLGRYSNGNFVLSRIEAEISAPSLTEPMKVTFAKAEADYSQSGWEVKYLVEPAAGKGWAIDGPTKKENRKAMVVTKEPVAVPEKATLTVRLVHEALNEHNIGRFRLSATSSSVEAITLQGDKFPAAVKQALTAEASKRTPAQKSELEKFFRANVDSPVKQAEGAVGLAKKQRMEAADKSPTVMVMREGPARDAFRLTRGEYDKRAEKVTAGLPVALPPMPDGAPMNRYGLAQWVVSPTNPLTARVWVNRAWERFFGVGLVKTSENLGSQADFPSHPDLLDWLAAEFMQPTSEQKVNGQPAQRWDMKAMHKLIVMSAAYRQSSALNKALAEKDPENRLVARGPRFRLSGEVLRDQALAMSGLLVERIGGPSVKPYMPEGVWDETTRYGDLRNYKHDAGDGLYRRSMYTIWKRTAAPPSMLIFDAPNREICTVKRSRTNTPLQALSLLNEITYVEAARKLGERMIAKGGTTADERVKYGFQLVTSREPTVIELKVLMDGLQSDLSRFREKKSEAEKLLTFGESKAANNTDPAEVAAYALTANVLLNLDEVVTRE